MDGEGGIHKISNGGQTALYLRVSTAEQTPDLHMMGSGPMRPALASISSGITAIPACRAAGRVAFNSTP
jgi:hypothetical protein